jgi:hypothetical protein
MNHHFNLTTEESPYADEATVPPEASFPSSYNLGGIRTWTPDATWKGWLDGVEDIPFECYVQIRSNYRDIDFDAGTYDYLMAFQGNIEAGLPANVPHLEAFAYRLNSTRVVYWGNMFAENEIDGIPHKLLSELVTTIWVERQNNQHYESIVVMEAGILVEPGYESLFPPENILITAGANATMYGYSPALPWGEKECSMPIDSLAASEITSRTS